MNQKTYIFISLALMALLCLALSPSEKGGLHTVRFLPPRVPLSSKHTFRSDEFTCFGVPVYSPQRFGVPFVVFEYEKGGCLVSKTKILYPVGIIANGIIAGVLVQGVQIIRRRKS